MRTPKTTITVLTALALTALAPVSAVGQTDAAVGDVAAAQDAAVAAIDRRLETLDRLHDAISASPHVTGEHRGALLGETGKHRGGLSALRAEILATDDREELRELIPSIATDFRIYLVFVPKVVGVLAADAAGAAVERAETEVVPRLEYWIDAVAGMGGDVTEAEAHLDDLRSEIAEVDSLAAGISGALLPLGASDWEQPARDVIEGAKADGEAARTAVSDAVESVREVIDALRAAAA